MTRMWNGSQGAVFLLRMPENQTSRVKHRYLVKTDTQGLFSHSLTPKLKTYPPLGAAMSTGFHARVLVAEDEEFTLNLLREVLEGSDFEVSAVQNVAEAIATIESFDPHAVITDLNFGVSGPNGADLLAFLDANHPWIGKIVLTSHSSPALAVPGGMTLPEDVTYMVKSELKSISNLIAAVKDSITKSNTVIMTPHEDGERIIISQAQGEILLLISEGLTNAAIAKKRGTSLRATETLVQRTFAILGLKNDEDFNPRVLAVRMWQQGKVVIR